MNEQHNKVAEKIRELSAAADNIEGAGVLVIACFEEDDDQLRTTVAANGRRVMIAKGIAEALADPNTEQVAELIHKGAELAALKSLAETKKLIEEAGIDLDGEDEENGSKTDE